MQKKIKVGIVGAAGYAGGELIRVLLNHPFADIAYAHSRSNSGGLVCDIHTDLAGETDLQFRSNIENNIDVLFLCLGHGESSDFLRNNRITDHVKIIDLSQDFRIRKEGNSFLYALPEYNKSEIAHAQYMANPGCFATAIQLALLPLAKECMLQDVHLTGITGATGAGQKLQQNAHFAWRSNNIQAYKSLSHQHLNEIKQTLNSLQPTLPELNFIPWRGDFARGIYVSGYLKSDLTLEDAYQMFQNFYHEAAFTFVSRRLIDLKQVVNTNKCFIHLEKEDGKLIIHTAIDNLLKGASGQAIQNMNIAFGFSEKSGLELKSSAF
ncbi:MAG: N-acetyl-gamma-glutamyl-phosphate reductase [Bacteroidota bacterium]